MDWFDSVKKESPDYGGIDPEKIRVHRFVERRRPYESDGETENKVYNLLRDLEKRSVESFKVLNQISDIAEKSDDNILAALLQEYRTKALEPYQMLDDIMKQLKHRREYT